MSKCVHIVGFAPSTRDMAGYNKEGVEVWVLNEWFTVIPRANNITRWFELHQRETVIESKRSAGYLDELKKTTIPIYMVKKYDDIEMSIAYPLDEIRKSLKTDYFTNSISYMVAMAIHEGYEDIHLYGVDMAQEEEYAKERPSVEYFIGYAQSRGINVYIPPESDICKTPYFYGFEEESAHKICTTIDPKKADLVSRINNDDLMVDEMLEHIDFQLKKYMFEDRLKVEEIKKKEIEINDLLKNLNLETDEIKKTEILKSIQSIQSAPIPINDIVFPMHDKFLKLWEYNQTLRGHKKSRLYLAGAKDIISHLRVILCPYD